MKHNFIAIHHVSFIVSDLVKSLHFYCDVLGLEQNHSRPEVAFDGAWININDTQQIHLLKLENPDSIVRPEHGGRDRHAAFRLKNLQVIEDSLQANNILFSKSHSGRVALFCRDPDGNTLELMQ